MSASLYKDIQAIMPISLVLIGTLSVSAILIVGIVSISQDHPLKTKTAMESIASSMHLMIHSVDASFIESHKQILLHDLPIPVSIQFSSDSLIVKGKDDTQRICVVSPVQIPWWIHDASSFWSNGSSFHQHLNTTYGHTGSIADPLEDDDDSIKNHLQSLLNSYQEKRLVDPFNVNMNKVVHIEKIFIYYDEPLLSQSFILVYQ